MDNFCISMSLHRPDTRVRPHSHEKPYLCFLLEGSYSENSSANSTIIETGTSIFRGADHEHANRFYRQGGTCFNIEINDQEKFMLENDFHLPKDGVSRLGTVNLYELLYFLKNDMPDDLLNILCYESVIRHFDMLPVQGKLDWIRRVKERIQDDPFTSISLSRLSEEFELHPNYIVRKFKDVTGYRLSEYLNKIRIELALAMMLRTDEKLTRIALDSGFCDQSHFNRNFRKYLSASPKNFRKTLKG